MSSEPRELIVTLDASEIGPRRPVGVVRRRPGPRPVISFEYARSWLEWADSFPIDPVLPLAPGESFVGGGHLPGVLSDTAPDRWGRRLLERREVLVARGEGRRARTLDDWGFLLGVADETRMGALRLSADRNGPFLDDREPSIPGITRLRTLEFAARRLEESPDARIDDPMIAALIAPGSSLGGARPKANFVEVDGSLWIAKFPSREDRRDVGAWEFLLTALAADAGITVPDTQRLSLSPSGTTFAARRFDRDGGNRRLFASAMTLTGKQDGEEASYLDLALAVTDHVVAAAIGPDLEQLFRRLIFNLLVGNRDDHLRNHGFLRRPEGWRLAPAYDLNTVPESAEHTLAIDGRSHAPDLSLALATREFYRLSGPQAETVVRDVAAALSSWQPRAKALGLPLAEISLIESHISYSIADTSAASGR